MKTVKVDMTENKAEAIMAIAMDFWRDKGRTLQDIRAVFDSGNKQLREAFFKPAVKIYIMLEEKFNNGEKKI